MSDPAAYPMIGIMLDNSSGVPTDIASYVDATKGMVVEADTKQYTYIPMSTGQEVEIAGSQKKVINLEAFDIPEAHTFFDAIFRKSSLDLALYPDGGGSGERKVTMVVSCTHVGSVGFFDGVYKFPVRLSVMSGPLETTV